MVDGGRASKKSPGFSLPGLQIVLSLGDSLKGPFPLDALIVSQRHRPPCARVAPGGLVDGGLCRRGPGRFRGELGEDLRKPPTDASPSAEIEFTLSKK